MRPFTELSRRKRYFRQLPLRRLVSLLLAIFCLFGMYGFLIDLFGTAQKPTPVVLAWTLFTGAMAVFYLIALTRAPEHPAPGEEIEPDRNNH